MTSKVISKTLSNFINNGNMKGIVPILYWCSLKALTERKLTKILNFSYFKLNDLEMTIKVTGKTVVKLF